MYKKPSPHDSWINSLIFPRTLAMQHICRHHYMIKLIKITRKYIKRGYTSDKHNLIVGIPWLQEWWRWHCYSHPNYLCLNLHNATLITQRWKLLSWKLKRIEKKDFTHIGGYTLLMKGSNCTNNIHAPRDVQKHCFIYPRTTLRIIATYARICISCWRC